MKTKLSVLAVLMTAILVTQALAAAIMPEPNVLSPGYPHNADAMWVELPSYDLTTATASVGDVFNVTVSANITEATFAWQVALLYDRTWLKCLDAGLTAGTTSEFFLNHTTVSGGPVIDTGFLGNGSVLMTETLLDNDSQTGPRSGTLIWAEFQIMAAPNETSGAYTGTFDISTEYYAASQETFFVGPTLKAIPLTPYDGFITYSWGQVGFVGVYRNFPEGSTDFPPLIQGQKAGLVYDSLPWRPTSLAETGYIQRDDWYEIPSCLVRIDPVVPVTISGITGEGLDFEGMTPTSTGSWPTQLNGGLPGDPFYFTAHWEARINVTAYNCSVMTESSDDSWLFVDGILPTQLDLGGTHSDMTSSLYILSPGIHTIDIFYAERSGVYAIFKVAFSPANAVTILDPSEIYAKKSLEDLLKHQAEGIESFEDLLGNLSADSRTSELFESLENLTEEQECLLNTFENMIAEETPQPYISIYGGVTSVAAYNTSRLLPAEFITLLESFEYLLHTQYDIKERFMDMLTESQTYLSQADFSTLLNSTEELLTSDDDLLASFENLACNLFPTLAYNTYTVDQQTYFLESYECLLEDQSQLLDKFQILISDPPVTQEQINASINLGVSWLAKQQDPSTGAWSLDYYPIASTAFAVIKFASWKMENNGNTTYDSNVMAGLKYLLSSGSSFQVNITADLIAHPSHWTGTGTPNTNGDGMGIYFRSTVGMSDPDVGQYSTTYETAIVMMALQAAEKSGFFSRTDKIPLGYDSAIAGKTYYVVMGDMVNFYAWAQNDVSSGTARGGWRYIPNEEDPVPWSDSSDNSVSQWPALGLLAAEDWGIYAPNWVKSELLNYWLAYSQNSGNGGFGYTDSSSPSIAMTAAGLIELTYCDVPTTDPRWDAARSYIGNNWNSDNEGNMYAMYAVMKAAMTAQPGAIWTFENVWWQNGTGEYDDYLVSNQNPDGSWPYTGDRDESPTQILATEWALLILEKIVPPPPPPSFKESFEDLLERQADRIKSFEDLVGLLPAANRAPELLESTENLIEEQEGLVNCFEGMINASSLAQTEFISLLNSTEDLLEKQYDIKGSFIDLLNETKPYLQADFSTFLSSTESLLRSDAQLLENFETLVTDLFNLPGVTTDTRVSFLESYEQLLESQSLLISRFEQLSGNLDPDVAVTNVDVSSTTVLPGDLVDINVNVQDPGAFAETFNVTVYAGSQVIEVQSVSLDSGSSTNLTFAWDTTSFASGQYTVSASASIVPGETNTADNTMLSEQIVTILSETSVGGGGSRMPYCD